MGRILRIKKNILPHKNLMNNYTPLEFSQFSPDSKKRKVETLDVLQKKIKIESNFVDETEVEEIDLKDTSQPEVSTYEIKLEPI